jgi:hypothetical protein
MAKTRTRLKPLLYSPSGDVLAWSGGPGLPTFYETANPWRDGDVPGLNLLNGPQDTDALLPRVDWETLLTEARLLLANSPVLKGVIMEQCDHSFPLTPHYTGPDREWGKIAKEWLYYHDMNCDVRGEPFDCHTGSRLRLIGRKVDGDIAQLLVLENDGSAAPMPRYQMIRAHRISSEGQKLTKDGRLEGGAWRGFKIKNGIVMDDYDRAVALCIKLGKNADASVNSLFVPESPKQLNDYGNLLPFRLIYDPMHTDQCRGITALEASTPSFKSHKEWHAAEMRAQRIQANETLYEHNDTGEAEDIDRGSDNQILTSALGIPFQTSLKGGVRYFRAGSGGKMDLVRPDRPSPAVMAFDDKTLTEAIYGLGWDPQFSLYFRDPGGHLSRVILKKIERKIRENQRIEARSQLHYKVWALSQAIKRGEIPAPKMGTITSWDFTGPPLPTGDSGNDRRNAMEEYKLGLLTAQKFFADQDMWWEEQYLQRRVECSARMTDAETLHKEHPEWTPQECFQILEQRTQQLTSTNDDPEPNPAGDKKPAKE